MSDDDSDDSSRLELSFEYLVAKNSLRWITLYTSQVIHSVVEHCIVFGSYSFCIGCAVGWNSCGSAGELMAFTWMAWQVI